jgi:hypothetical protein
MIDCPDSSGGDAADEAAEDEAAFFLNLPAMALMLFSPA